jgi:hypothetical protein
MKRRKMDAERAVDQLIGMGYLKYVPPSEVASIREELIGTLRRGYLESEWDKECVSRDHRSYPADSEELAEGCLGEVLLLMKDVLQKEGVQLRSVEEDVQDYHYVVVVNGRRHLIYDTDILNQGNSWGVAAKRLLELVNDLLKQAGSKERLYGIYGGNDGRVILLTEEMYGLLHAPELKVDPGWMPYTPDAIRDDGRMER